MGALFDIGVAGNVSALDAYMRHDKALHNMEVPAETDAGDESKNLLKGLLDALADEKEKE